MNDSLFVSSRVNGDIQLWSNSIDGVDEKSQVYTMNRLMPTTSKCIGLKRIYNHNKHIFTSYSDSGEVYIWDINDTDDTILQELNTFTVKGPIEAAAACSDSIVFGGKENDLLLYDIEQGQCIWQAKNVLNDNLNLRVPIWHTSVDFLHSTTDSTSTSGALIASGTGYKHIRLYDVKNTDTRPIYSYELNTDFRITSIHSNHSIQEYTIYVGDTSGGLSLYDLRIGKRLCTLKGSVGSIRDIQLSPSRYTGKGHNSEGGYVASVGLDRALYIYNTNTYKLMEKHYMKNRLNCCCFIGQFNSTLSSTRHNSARPTTTSDSHDEDDDGEYNSDEDGVGYEDEVEDYDDEGEEDGGEEGDADGGDEGLFEVEQEEGEEEREYPKKKKGKRG